MDTNRRSTRSCGQGTVEYLGIVVVVALLVGAGALAVARLRPTPHSSEVEHMVDAVPLVDLLRPADPPPPGLLSRTVGRAARSVRLLARGQWAFTEGFTRAAIQDVGALVRDPVGVLLGTPGDGVGLITALAHPIATGRAQLADARRYVRALRAMDRGEAFVRVMGDLGAAGEDVVVSRGRRMIVKRAVRAGRRLRRRDPDVTPQIPANGSSHN